MSVKSNPPKQGQLYKEVFDKRSFNNTIDTSFNELLPSDDPSFFNLDLATIGDFFQLYLKLFDQIPKLGEINSHEYLAKTSGEFISYQPQQEEIQALLNELTQLREENLQLRLDFANALGAEFGGSDDGSDRTILDAAGQEVSPRVIPSGAVTPSSGGRNNSVPLPPPSGGSGGASGGGGGGGSSPTLGRRGSSNQL